MITSSLSLAEQTVRHHYLSLPFSHTQVACPYFNNKKMKMRGALRVLIGKGSPQEIVDEAEMIAFKEHVDLKKISAELLTKFLVDHHLGIDCSGLAYYILNARSLEKTGKNLHKHLTFPWAHGLRKLLVLLRPIENTSVRVLAAEENSTLVPLEDVQPGDLIIMKNTGVRHDFDHCMIVHETERHTQTNQICTIRYTHALPWSIDGLYQHCVRTGEILITNPLSPLTSATWQEQGVSGPQHETLGRAVSAEVIEIRRIL